MQAYSRAKNHLERWISGDKAGLWKEVLEEDARRRDKKKSKGGMGREEREDRVKKLAGLGR
eukprot:7186575-Karenia_brevis.AAC.1